MDNFEEYTKRAGEYAKARGSVSIAFKGDHENHEAVSAWLDYWTARGFSRAVAAMRAHVEAGRTITVPCLDPDRFDPDFMRRYPKDWRPRPAPYRTLEERQALLRRLGLRPQVDDAPEYR